MPQPSAPSPVPLALWPCAEPDRSRRPHARNPRLVTDLPAPLAQRLLTEYTTAGDLVIDATLHPSDQESTLRHAARTLRRDLARLNATDLPVAALAEGAARLMVAITPLAVAPGTTLGRMLVEAATWLLAPGGLLAVVVPPVHRHASSAEQDAVTHAVRLAEGAGLGYLQHVIALLVPIHDGQLAPPAFPRGHRSSDRDIPVHRPAHADVLVFATPTEMEAASA